MELTGAQIVMKSLEDEGVETIFGIPGGTVVPLYDAIFDSKIKHVLVRHEQAAAHAADGFSRASCSDDKVGVCVATSGPGATNLVTGIAMRAAVQCRIPVCSSDCVEASAGAPTA